MSDKKSDKDTKLTEAQQERLEEVAKIISRYVRRDSNQYTEVNPTTGEINTSLHSQHHHPSILPRDLQEVFEDFAKEPGKLPAEWAKRLKKLKSDIDHAKNELSAEEKTKLSEALEALKKEEPFDGDLPEASQKAMETINRLRQEVGTELLHEWELKQEEQNQQDQEDDSDEMPDDGDEEGDGGGDGDEGDEEGEGQGQPGEGDQGGSADDLAKYLEQLEDGDEEEQDSALGPNAPPVPPEAAYDLSGAEADPTEVQQFLTALQHLMSRQSEDPTRLPEWNLPDLTKRLITLQNPLPAKKPTLQPMDILLIIDVSGSMNPFADQARTLAKCAFNTGKTSGFRIVVTTTSNGDFNVNASLGSHGVPAGVYWVDGEFKGRLPNPNERGFDFRHADYARMWKWYCENYLPRQYSIRPKVVLFFSDDHGAYQWNWMSHNMDRVFLVWLDPRAPGTVDEDMTGEAGMVELKNVEQKGSSADASFEGITTPPPREFMKFKSPHRYFAGLMDISDIVRAMKKVAGF